MTHTNTHTHTVLSFIWGLITTDSWSKMQTVGWLLSDTTLTCYHMDLIEDAICAWWMYSVEPLWFPDIKGVVKNGVFQHPSTFHTGIRYSVTYWRSQFVISGITFQNVICKVFIIYVDHLIHVWSQIKPYVFRSWEHDDYSPSLILCSLYTAHQVSTGYSVMFAGALSYSNYFSVVVQ